MFRFLIIPITLAISLPLLGAADSFKVKCTDRIVIVPPRTSDPITAEMMAKQVIRYYDDELAKVDSDSNCEAFLPYDETVGELDRLGFTANFQAKVSGMRTRQVEILWERTKATHVAEIEFDGEFFNQKSQKRPTRFLTIAFYAIGEERESLNLVGRHNIRVEAAEISKDRLTLVPRLLSRMTPNSISLSPGATVVWPSFSDGAGNRYEVTELHNHGIIPPIISATRFSRVEHPDGYRMFDYEFSLFPSTMLLFVNQDIELRKSSEGDATNADQSQETYKLRLKYIAGCTSAAVQMSLFSLIGTTYAGLGFGPCFIHNESRGRFAVNYFDTSTSLQVGHRIFLTKHFFVDVTIESINFGHDIYQDERAKLEAASRTYVLLGYYVDNAEGLFAKSWKYVFD